jgi:hypothetical protein
MHSSRTPSICTESRVSDGPVQSPGREPGVEERDQMGNYMET